MDRKRKINTILLSLILLVPFVFSVSQAAGKPQGIIIEGSQYIIIDGDVLLEVALINSGHTAFNVSGTLAFPYDFDIGITTDGFPVIEIIDK